MAADPIKTPTGGATAGQRVRVGLTGLAFVFLLVMLATALLRQAGGDIAPAAGANATVPSEPLAELGVAPGNVPPAVAPSAPPPGRPAAAH